MIHLQTTIAWRNPGEYISSSKPRECKGASTLSKNRHRHQKRFRGYTPKSAQSQQRKGYKLLVTIAPWVLSLAAAFGIYHYLTRAKAPGKEIPTGSGLKYIDEVVGTGVSPSFGKTVVVHYTGRLQDGTKFDSSVDRGTPFEFPIGMGKVIKGWDEGVMTMKVGGKRQLIIPPALGYGSQPAGKIPPNSTLIFDVELLAVK
jgi:peptidylprolyl isomerase